MLSSTWQSVAIGGGGDVIGIVASTTGSAIYAQTDVGGAFRWVSAGDGVNGSWAPITDSLPDDSTNEGMLYSIGALAVDPANAKKVYIACGGWSYNTLSGIYVTQDASVASPTWTSIDSTIRVRGGEVPFKVMGERLAVDPNNSNVVYYGTNNISGGGTGLKKYVYNGTSWTSVAIAQPGAIGDAGYGFSFVACDAGGGTVSDGTRTVSKYIYAGAYSVTAGSGGVYASSNGGTTWTKISTVAVDKPHRGEVAADGTLYVTFDGTFASNGGVVKVARGATEIGRAHV
jgi:hypothetical protein